MQDVDRYAGQLEHLGLREPPRPCLLIDIPANGRHGCNLSKLIENLGRSHITGMNDALGPAQSCDSFWPKQPVRIGNDPNENGSPLPAKCWRASLLADAARVEFRTRGANSS